MKKEKKLTLVTLILMIFTSVFGFTNIPRSYYLMGYSAVPWYILSALLFFIPYAFMMAEYGAAFKNEGGGIYSWMEASVSTKYAFVGTFMWYASYIMWMVNISSSIWIVVSTAIFGKDTTSSWHLFGLNSTQTMGFLGVLMIITITFTSTKGLEKITKITSIGGIAVTGLNLVLLLGSILILALNGVEFAQPVSNFKEIMTVSPNTAYQSLISVISFVVFFIFAFGGIEVIGGLSDKTENAEKVFPKGVTMAAVIIAIGYAIGIFLCGVSANWNEVLSSPNVHMGNVAYVFMENLEYKLGLGLGMSEYASVSLGLIISGYMGISMVLALVGAFFTLSYAPLKTFIKGTPKDMWPEYFNKEENGMPVSAMWVQCFTVSVIIILVSFGGEGAAKFFSKLILMTNVAMTIPYIFIAAAFPAFKKKQHIKKHFEIYKNHKIVVLATFCTTVTIIMANAATIAAPYIESRDLESTLWMLAGPVIFISAALWIYNRYERKAAKIKVEA